MSKTTKWPEPYATLVQHGETGRTTSVPNEPGALSDFLESNKGWHMAAMLYTAGQVEKIVSQELASLRSELEAARGKLRR